ncbi:PTS system, cellobiose-specific IIB component [Clostridium cavendishii DSM 21758]|uniref:PTS system, cellobiose-specific IIB component n=1 Tax=Clostridium cavendishii DSM 21758 TaxID=1121302 RepID=A0A1M6QF47_9CLOT|nr:PTS sugar transporter subunit IIB [Clostridium cavendishii]SHK18677.1 PTS system, cellobiose-specific IIB component [Clostridium cavendishii DSM 21758]
MNILLVCANGASTGVLVEKMKTFCKEHEKLRTKEIKIEATSVDNLRVYFESNKVDVVLIGPQIRFKEDEIKNISKPYTELVQVINTQDYGRMDAVAVMKTAIKLYRNR